MRTGFGHFDESGGENFCAAVLCLLLEVDEDARTAFVRLLEDRTGRALGSLSDVEREVWLPGGAASRRRSDLHLRFGSGVILVEVKTKNEWDTGEVVRQIEDQAASTSRPLAVVLLAPTGLGERVQRALPTSPKAVPIYTLRWTEVMRTMRSGSPIAERALRHWEENVEQDYSLSRDFSADAMVEAVQQVSCLRAFLRACAQSIDGRPSRIELNTTLPDSPREMAGWCWHGLSVPLTQPGHRIGIYRYLAVPPGQEAFLRDSWLILFTDHDPIVRIPFAPARTDQPSLDERRAAFCAEFARVRPAGLTGAHPPR